MKFRRIKRETGLALVWFVPGQGFSRDWICMEGRLQAKVLGIWWTIKTYRFNVIGK